MFLRRAPDSRAFWDAAARDNAAFYVATGFTSETAEFFALGSRETDAYLALCGVEITKTDRVLEIGSGVGRMTRRLAELGSEVLAVDVSPEMLQRLEGNLADLSNVRPVLVPGDGSLPGVEDATVDVVFSYLVLQHVPTVQAQLAYLESALRVVNPAGVICIQIRAVSVLARALDTLAQLAHRLRGRRTLRPEYRGCRIARAELRAIADRAGGSLEIRPASRRHDWIIARPRAAEGCATLDG